MEGIERLRSEAVGGELRRLVDDMVAIACRMPDEVERVAEVREFRLSGDGSESEDVYTAFMPFTMTIDRVYPKGKYSKQYV